MTKTDAMQKIHDDVVALQSSPLYEYRTSNGYVPVTGEGSYDSKIMMIGEAPGKREAKTGKPFCGAAGKVLDILLAHINIPRDSIYITNIVKDRPPENRDPTATEIAVYGPLLDRQIEIIQPKVIVTLGRYAMGYIMKRFNLEEQLEPISKAHGVTYHAKASYGNIDIVALYHPCVAVYNPHNINNLKKDFEVLQQYIQ